LNKFGEAAELRKTKELMGIKKKGRNIHVLS